MPCDVDFLPSHIIELMNLLTSVEPYTGSAAPSRFAIYPFRGIVVSISSTSVAVSKWPTTNDRQPTTASTLWAVSLHTLSGSAYGRPRRLHPECRAQRGNARPAGPSRGLRGSAQSSAPAGCDRRRECRL